MGHGQVITAGSQTSHLCTGLSDTLAVDPDLRLRNGRIDMQHSIEGLQIDLRHLPFLLVELHLALHRLVERSLGPIGVLAQWQIDLHETVARTVETAIDIEDRIGRIDLKDRPLLARLILLVQAVRDQIGRIVFLLFQPLTGNLPRDLTIIGMRNGEVCTLVGKQEAHITIRLFGGELLRPHGKQEA